MEVINKALQKSCVVCDRYNNILVSISGGADSDIMLDILLKTCDKQKLNFVFFDTGIEYKATKEHLIYLENKYNISINIINAFKPVPNGCKEYGQPFLSKFISQMLDRLQQHNFDFINDGNKTYEELMQKYHNLKSALSWWCNENGENSTFNINKNYLLKEFIISNPPTFKISDKCCNGAKKNTSKLFESKNNFDLKCIGLRKSEGGIRSTRYKSCFEWNSKEKTQTFRPIWWLSNEDKIKYEKLYNIVHSDCYTKYGLKRTGCAGCPFNSKFENELKIIEKFEPQLYKACNFIFKDSYEYTRKYREFKTKKHVF